MIYENCEGCVYTLKDFLHYHIIIIYYSNSCVSHIINKTWKFGSINEVNSRPPEGRGIIINHESYQHQFRHAQRLLSVPAADHSNYPQPQIYV